MARTTPSADWISISSIAAFLYSDQSETSDTLPPIIPLSLRRRRRRRRLLNVRVHLQVITIRRAPTLRDIGVHSQEEFSSPKDFLLERFSFGGRLFPSLTTCSLLSLSRPADRRQIWLIHEWCLGDWGWEPLGDQLSDAGRSTVFHEFYFRC